VILETDQALLAVTKTRVLGNAAVTVTFDPPARPWIQALKTPAVNFFLFDIRENTHRRDVMYEQVRDEDGRVIGHRPPALRYDLHYTVSVWGAPIAMEHRILALVLRCFGGMSTLPRELLPEALAKSPLDVHLTTAAGTKRGMFLSLAGEVKAGFELTATVPMPVPDVPAAAPVTHAQVVTAPPRDAASNGAAVSDSVSKDPAVKDTAAKDTASTDAGSTGTASTGTAATATAASDAAPKDSASKGTASTGSDSSGAASSQAASKDPASKDSASEDMASKDTASKDAAPKETASNSAATSEKAPQDAASNAKGTAPQDTASAEGAAAAQPGAAG
jgi:hypothetical protein